MRSTPGEPPTSAPLRSSISASAGPARSAPQPRVLFTKLGKTGKGTRCRSAQRRPNQQHSPKVHTTP